MPVYNTPPDLLREAVESVLAQSYEHWELVLADDASTDPSLQAYLSKGLPNDPRVRLVRRAENGNISAATNTAAEHAAGDFFVLLDHDDLLHPDALAHLALAVDREGDVDLLYSDDDKVGLDGSRFAPQFKPDWSPELLLSFVDGALQAGVAAASKEGSTTINTGQAQSVIAESLRGSIDLPPTLRKNPGEPVSVFVARDLDFSTVYRLQPAGGPP